MAGVTFDCDGRHTLSQKDAQAKLDTERKIPNQYKQECLCHTVVVRGDLDHSTIRRLLADWGSGMIREWWPRDAPQFSWRKILKPQPEGGCGGVSLLLRRGSSAQHSGAASFNYMNCKGAPHITVITLPGCARKP